MAARAHRRCVVTSTDRLFLSPPSPPEHLLRFWPRAQQGVLNIIVSDRGTWVINKQSPNRQIWWSSPISGPMRFEYDEDGERWVNTRDGKTDLRSILSAEMKEKCNVSLERLVLP
ncbi:unnamed protein product [Laminaria digitata]